MHHHHHHFSDLSSLSLFHISIHSEQEFGGWKNNILSFFVSGLVVSCILWEVRRHSVELRVGKGK